MTKYLSVLLILAATCVASDDFNGQIEDLLNTLKQAKYYEEHAKINEQLGYEEMANNDRQESIELRIRARRQIEEIEINIIGLGKIMV